MSRESVLQQLDQFQAGPRQVVHVARDAPPPIREERRWTRADKLTAAAIAIAVASLGVSVAAIAAGGAVTAAARARRKAR